MVACLSIGLITCILSALIAGAQNCRLTSLLYSLPSLSHSRKNYACDSDGGGDSSKKIVH